MAKETWFTCPHCGHQFKADARHNHHCPRCNTYPVLVGKTKITPDQPQPRPTAPLPQPRPTIPLPQPTQSGQFSMAEQPTYPGTLLPQKEGRLAKFRRQPRRIQVVIGAVLLAGVFIVTVCCASGYDLVFGHYFSTPTPGVVAQANKATPTRGPATPPTGQTATATSTPKPQPTATATPILPTATPAPPTATSAPACPYPAVLNNPWCYTFTYTGKVITNPAAGFCGLFPCIPNFYNGNGYVVECGDGNYSKSGGLSGVCSRHGGYQATLYMP